MKTALGVDYDEQITQAVSYVQAVMTKLGDGPMIVADKTGVGDAVIDTLRSALRDAGVLGDVDVTPIFIKGAGSFTRNARYGFNVSIEDIIHNAAILLQRGQIKFSAGIPLIETALAELASFTIKKNRRNPDQDRYEAWGEGMHDDIVFALVLPLWLAETCYGYPKYVDLSGQVIADAPVFTYG